jgi:hypothetical protein
LCIAVAARLFLRDSFAVQEWATFTEIDCVLCSRIGLL